MRPRDGLALPNCTNPANPWEKKPVPSKPGQMCRVCQGGCEHWVEVDEEGFWADDGEQEWRQKVKEWDEKGWRRVDPIERPVEVDSRAEEYLQVLEWVALM